MGRPPPLNWKRSPLSVERAFNTLRSFRLNSGELDGQSLCGLTVMTSEQRTLLEQLGCREPELAEAVARISDSCPQELNDLLL